MGCNCGKKKRDAHKVQLPGGLSITKSSKAEADAYAAKHPGSKVVKA